MIDVEIGHQAALFIQAASPAASGFIIDAGGFVVAAHGVDETDARPSLCSAGESRSPCSCWLRLIGWRRGRAWRSSDCQRRHLDEDDLRSCDVCASLMACRPQCLVGGGTGDVTGGGVSAAALTFRGVCERWRRHARPAKPWSAAAWAAQAAVVEPAWASAQALARWADQALRPMRRRGS